MALPARTGAVATARQTSQASDEGASATPSDSAPWFVPALSVLVVLGIGMRIIYALVWEDNVVLSGDPKFFQLTAAALSRGNGYAEPFLSKGGPVPTALHPPFFSILLALLNVVRLESPDAHRIALAFITAAGIVVMGLLGRRLMNPATGLVAAGCAALSPLWIQWGGRLLSESLYLVVVPCVLWVALECVDRPRWWIFGVAGLVIGVAALTRSEAIGFVVLLGVPLVIMGAREWKWRARYGAVFVLGVIVIVGPWLVRNEVQLGGWVLSTDSGTTLVGAYSPKTFAPSSPLYGSFDNDIQFAYAVVMLEYGTPPGHAKAWTELTMNQAMGNDGKTFAREHLSDLPGVVLAREGRLWGVYSPETQLHNDGGDGGQVPEFYIAAWFVEWIAIPLSVIGGIVLSRKSPRHLLILLAPIVLAALNAAIFFGSTRLRVVAEPSLFLLSSIAIVAVIQRVSNRRTRIDNHAVGTE